MTGQVETRPHVFSPFSFPFFPPFKDCGLVEGLMNIWSPLSLQECHLE